MTARAGVILIVTAISLSAAATSDAQVWTVEQDRAAFGLSAGRASDGDSGHGFAWNGTFELPTFPTWRFRADVGRVRWHFDQDFGGRFPERSAMTRASVSVVRTPQFASAHVNGYAGGGAGVYWFSAPKGQGFSRFGMHALLGMEFPLPKERAKIVGEIRLDLMRSPGLGAPVVTPLQGSAVLGVRWIWKPSSVPSPTGD